MGCSPSKSKLRLYKRISNYQIESYKEEKQNLKIYPNSFTLYSINPDLIITVQEFHNLFFDGFYCPYIKNPYYLLVIDARTEEAFRKKHIATAKWYGALAIGETNYSMYTCVVIYDDDGRSYNDLTKANSNELLNFLKDRSIKPRCIDGGFEALEKTSLKIWNCHTNLVRQRIVVLQWYPSIILESFLYLGRTDQALNPLVIKDMNLTHIVCLTHTVPAHVFPYLSYLVLPLSEEKSLDLIENLQKIIQFIDEAGQKRGRILVHCEQGVKRGAAVIIGYLMHYKSCTLEDAYDYVSQMRTVSLESSPFLNQLSAFEEQMFGRKLTDIEELW